MEKNQEPIQQLTEIRNMMERSSRFISLSGLSGVSAGVIALLGAGFAYLYCGNDLGYFNFSKHFTVVSNLTPHHTVLILALDAMIMLALAIISGIYFTTMKARKKGLKVWDATAKRLVINLFIPLAAGGMFCLAMFYHHLFFLISPATLIFYGLALINASKYTFHEVRVLGIAEIILGLLASWLVGYGLLLWTIGFGLLHIFYGMMMYYRYDMLKSNNSR